MIPDELKAEAGDKILPKFKKLVAWIDSQRLVSVDDRVLINSTPVNIFCPYLKLDILSLILIFFRLLDLEGI